MQVLLMQDFDGQQWSACYDFYQRIYQESYPYREMPTREIFLQTSRPLNAMTSGLLGFVLCRGNEWLACCHYKVTPENAALTSEVKFLKAAFDAETAGWMQKELLKICRAQKLSVLQMVTENTTVKDYYVRSGNFQKVGQVRESVLDVTQLDPVQQKSWLEPVRSYQLRAIDWTNEREVEDLVLLHNETIEDAPIQGVVAVSRARDKAYFLELHTSLQGQNLELLAYGLYDKDRLIGLAMFECRLQDPQTFLIQYTGVDRRYRGQGLAKGLKAWTVEQLRREFPRFRFVVTGNEETNAPMLHINLAMGFTVRSEFTMLRYQGSACQAL